MIRKGDIFEIPLQNGYKAFGQYIQRCRMGPLIQVFDQITQEDLSVEQLIGAIPLFPPVYTGLFAAIKSGLWKKIGHLPVKVRDHPMFVSTPLNNITRKASTWYLYDGEQYIRIGNHLPEEYKKLEFLVVWSPFDVVERIETGKYPYPYGQLIEKNEYPMVDS